MLRRKWIVTSKILAWVQMSTLIGHSKEVQSVSFAPDGTRVSSSSEDATIKFWDANNDADVSTVESLLQARNMRLVSYH